MNIPLLLQLTLLLCIVVQASDYSNKSEFSAKTEHVSAYSGEIEPFFDDDMTSHSSDNLDFENGITYWDEQEERVLPYPFETAHLLTHVTTLDLSDNDLSEVPLLPPNLIKLVLASNAIAQVRGDFSWPISLEILDLSWNKFKEVPCRLPDSLRTLLLKKNQIKEFPTVLPKSLELLDLEANKIKTVSGNVAVPNGLRTVRLQRNGVSKKLGICLLEDTVNARRSAKQPKLRIEID